MVEDDAVAIDAEGRGVDDLAAVRRHDRGVDDARQVEAEVRLAVHLLAVVEVGPLVREGGLDRGVGEGMEDGAAPEDLRRGLRSEAGDLVCVLAPQLAVDDQEFVEDGPLRIDLVCRLQDRGDHAVEEGVVELDAALLEGLGKRETVEVRAGRVARLVLREGEHRRVDVLVVAERDERNLHGGVGDVDPFELRAARRIARILQVADLYP